MFETNLFERSKIVGNPTDRLLTRAGCACTQQRLQFLYGVENPQGVFWKPLGLWHLLAQLPLISVHVFVAPAGEVEDDQVVGGEARQAFD